MQEHKRGNKQHQPLVAFPHILKVTCWMKVEACSENLKALKRKVEHMARKHARANTMTLNKDAHTGDFQVLHDASSYR